MNNYEPEFNRIMAHKNSTDLLLERIFNPKRFPEFHAYLDSIHDAWIRECGPLKIQPPKDSGSREPHVRIWHYRGFL